MAFGAVGTWHKHEKAGANMGHVGLMYDLKLAAGLVLGRKAMWARGRRQCVKRWPEGLRGGLLGVGPNEAWAYRPGLVVGLC